MAVLYSDYIAALKSGVYKPIIQIDWLRPDETVYQTLTTNLENSSGTLTAQRVNGQRRSLDFTIINTDKTYIPNPDGIWIRQKFKLYLGLNINGEDFLLPQGIFVLENPAVTSNFSETKIAIKSLDKFSIMDGTLGGELDSTFIIPVGSNIQAAVQNILSLSGDPQSPIFYTGWVAEVTPYTIIKERGNGTLGEIIVDLAGMLSALVYYDEEGRLNFVPDVKDFEKASVWDFTTEEVNYQGATYTQEFAKVFNECIVVGDNINGATVTAMTKNMNLTSPTSIPNVGFTRPLIITDPIINTVPLAQVRSEYELRQVMRVLASSNMNSIPMYHLNPEDVITITDVKNLGLNEQRLIVNGFSLPLQIGAQMTIDAADTAELAFTT